MNICIGWEIYDLLYEQLFSSLFHLRMFAKTKSPEEKAVIIMLMIGS